MSFVFSPEDISLMSVMFGSFVPLKNLNIWILFLLFRRASSSVRDSVPFLYAPLSMMVEMPVLLIWLEM